MIKRKVKPRKRKNPYREDKIDDSINIEKSRYSYKYGYLYGLINGLKQLEFYPFWPDDESVIIDEVYYIKGHDKGFNDSIQQLKLIPKNKLKQYIKELEEEISSILLISGDSGNLTKSGKKITNFEINGSSVLPF